ncbi:hypothetical protein D9M68_950250 [compost metagenome]
MKAPVSADSLVGEMTAGLAADALRLEIRVRMLLNALTSCSGVSALKNSPRELSAACQRS